MPNMRWHTACAGVCMTKTVASLPSVRWGRSMWAALRALSPMISRCNLSPLFAWPLHHGAPSVIDLAPQRSLGALHGGPITAAAPPSASRSTCGRFGVLRRSWSEPAHAGSKVAHLRVVASSTSHMRPLSRSKPCSTSRVVVASMTSTIARPVLSPGGLRR